VSILITDTASSPERIAANELIKTLKEIYPDVGFSLNTSGSGRVIRIGTPSSSPDLLKHVDAAKLKGPESYLVTTAVIDGKKTGIILGADPLGVMYGVYGLLEKLGCGFFISFDAIARPSETGFCFDAWDITNHPLFEDRLVFPWHNFLSGPTGWDLKDWKKYIEQAQKGGFNTLKVHAYGNNPMFSFSFKGMNKPVGYLASSDKGRDWATTHVNDARRMIGGFLFDDSVFACEAAKVPDNKRVESVQSMMRKAFEYAAQRGVKVNFGLDFDLRSCNPQDIIKSMDESDRFRVDYKGIGWMDEAPGEVWLVRPDTSDGYAYYKAQANALLSAYPAIDTVTLWRRNDGSLWTALTFEQMPAEWQAEYKAYVETHPAAAELKQSVAAFGMAKVIKAWRKALDEMGQQNVKLAMGSWNASWIPGAVEFFPEEIKFVALTLGSEMTGKRMIPIFWAHHDDVTYIGAPHKPTGNLAGALNGPGVGGCGVLHWLTHPLDIYLTSIARQLWKNSSEEGKLETISGWMAERCFAPENKEVMGAYLTSWIKTMPNFSRETGDLFIEKCHIDKNIGDLEGFSKKRDARLAILKKADLSVMTDQQKKQYQFFVDYEQFISDIVHTHARYEEAREKIKAGNIDEARKLILACDPQKVVEEYAQAIRRVGPTRGQEGLVFSMNLRWIPVFTRLRQQLGLEPVRYNFGPTAHETLAQAPGYLTYYIGPDKTLWQTLGNAETGTEVFAIQNVAAGENTDGTIAEICGNGIQRAGPLTITLSPIPRKYKNKVLDKAVFGEESIPAGEYKLSLMMAEPDASSVGDRVMKVIVSSRKKGEKATGSGKETELGEIDILKLAGSRNKVLVVEYPVTLESNGTLDVTLVPTKGKALICGAVLSPR
jgi:hypothetical protein